MRIDEFNELDAAAARDLAAVWAPLPAWIDTVVAARPFASVDDLAATAIAASRAWDRADLDAALAHHPRIGERAAGHGASATASRTEQASMASAAEQTAAAIAAGNAAYEERFGRVFLIRAAGRSPDEILGELTRRLTNDDEAEASEALDQLAQIAVLRLRTALTDPAEGDHA